MKQHLIYAIQRFYCVILINAQLDQSLQRKTIKSKTLDMGHANCHTNETVDVEIS